MKLILMFLSILGLLLTVVPSFLVFYDIIEMPTHFNLMLVGLILWFSTAPFWMKSPSLDNEEK